MMKITVRAPERRQLESVCKTTADARLRTRCQAILLAHRGRRPRPIAEELGVTVRTRPRWLRAYQQARLAGRKLRRRPGRSARMPAALAPEVLGWLLQGPPGCGLERANWTAAELATPLYRSHGITARARTRRASWSRDGGRPYRPTSRALKAGPAQQAVARQDLQALPTRPRPETWSC